MSVFESLKQHISGEVLFTNSDRIQYATDASMYQIMPDIIVVPANEADVHHTLKIAREHHMPILPRGSGTSLAGQTVNKGIVLDFTKYFNKIISVEGNTAIVQPGVTRDQLNVFVKPQGLHFSPDPATSNRATFGGMIANNSSGTRSILYGKTIDHVISLKVMLSDGRIVSFSEKSFDEISHIIDNKEPNHDLYESFRNLIFENSEEILARYPKVMRRVCAYPLDEFVNKESWNLAKIFSGSEGTLGVILEATVNLTPLPKFQNMVVVHFGDRIDAIRCVKDMTQFNPASIEMLDYNVIELSKHNSITKVYYDKLITGNPQAIMTVEFYGETPVLLEEHTNRFIDHLRTSGKTYAYPVLTAKEDIEDAQSLRKDGLGLIMGKPGKRKPQAFVEDSAIPLEHLPDYIVQVEEYCTSLGVEMVVYAHASVGVLHIRPILDLMDHDDINRMKLISQFAFDRVKEYGGSWSGEHGDGRVRSYQIEHYFGPKLTAAFHSLKQIFDPYQLLNPGVILNPQAMDEHLRYGTDFKEKDQNFVFKYRKENSFYDVVHNCSGVGACRKLSGGTMCPSFRATGNEKDSTRGRANVLRMAMSGQENLQDLSVDEAVEVLDLCLSCKACKSECPSNVDMAKLKSEVLQIRYDKKGIPLSSRSPLMMRSIAKFSSGRLAGLTNNLLRSKPFRWFLEKTGGVDHRRILPLYEKKNKLVHPNRTEHSPGEKRVVLFVDTYIQFHQHATGQAALTLLDACGYSIEILEAGCCQRPLISNGFLRKAKTYGAQTAEKLRPFLEAGIPIVVVEPSCATALMDDLPDLLEDEVLSELMGKGIKPIEVFLAEEKAKGKINGKFSLKNNTAHVLHGHCHQKATYTTAAIHALLQGQNLKELDSGCCGMAGAFGYEKNHFDISKKIAEQSILGKLSVYSEDTVVIANGFSCKHQIHDFAGRETMHFVEAVIYEVEY